MSAHKQHKIYVHIRLCTLMIQAVCCVWNSERCNLQGNCAVLRETSIVGRPTVARKDLILDVNTTQGVGGGEQDYR